MPALDDLLGLGEIWEGRLEWGEGLGKESWRSGSYAGFEETDFGLRERGKRRKKMIQDE